MTTYYSGWSTPRKTTTLFRPILSLAERSKNWFIKFNVKKSQILKVTRRKTVTKPAYPIPSIEKIWTKWARPYIFGLSSTNNSAEQRNEDTITAGYYRKQGKQHTHGSQEKHETMVKDDYSLGIYIASTTNWNIQQLCGIQSEIREYK